MQKKQKGFSLIELLIVVAIILIIAAIAIPNLLRSRMAANEASAVGSCRTIATAETTYASTYPDQGYSSTLAKLGGTGASASSTSALLIDNVLAAGTKSGYGFILTSDNATPSVYYSVAATPTSAGQSGQRGFFDDASGVIRFTANGVAPTTADSAL